VFGLADFSPYGSYAARGGIFFDTGTVSNAIIDGMTLLAFTIKAHTGLRLAELGFLAGAIGGVLLMFGRRIGTEFGGLALTVAFVLLIVATHWGHFR
jgi:hypothetical protein